MNPKKWLFLCFYSWNRNSGSCGFWTVAIRIPPNDGRSVVLCCFFGYRQVNLNVVGTVTILKCVSPVIWKKNYTAIATFITSGWWL